MARLGFLFLATTTVLGACSLINAPADVKPGGDGGGANGAGAAQSSSDTTSVTGGGGQGGSPIPVCGNGVVEADEDCDDGDASSPLDACSADCKITEFDVVKDPSVSNELPGIGTSGTDGKGYFVVWRYRGSEADPNDDAIRGQAFLADGGKMGDVLALSTTPGPGSARIGTNKLGRSIIAWQSSSESNIVRYRVIEPDGMPTQTLNDMINSKSVGLISVGASETNDFALVWLETNESACCVSTPTPNCPANVSIQNCVCAIDPYCCNFLWDSLCVTEAQSCGAFCAPAANARAFDKDGSSFLTNPVTLGSAANASDFPGVWGEKDGFIACWNTPGGNLGCYKLLANGTPDPAVPLFYLATGGTDASPNRNPSGAYVGPDQQFIAVYEAPVDINGVKHRIHKRLFTSAGNSGVTGEEVSSVHHEEQESRVARHSNGRYVVVWTDTEPDPADPMDGGQIMARVFKPDGVAIGPQFVVNQVKAGTQHWPGVAVNADGDAMFVWSNEEIVDKKRISAVIYPRLLVKDP